MPDAVPGAGFRYWLQITQLLHGGVWIHPGISVSNSCTEAYYSSYFICELKKKKKKANRIILTAG